jgi:NRPS condensation-like uncharacterized protein
LRMQTYTAQAFDAMQFFYGDVQPPRIRCRIRFYERLDTAALRNAVDATLQAHPLLACVFNVQRHRWEAAGFTAENVVREITDGGDACALKCLLASIDETREPQLKLFLIRQAGGDELCAVINHMVCDGAGFKEALYELAAFYSLFVTGENPSPLPDAPGSRSFRRLTKPLGLRGCLKVLLSPTSPCKRVPAPLIPFRGGHGRPVLVMMRLEPETFSALCLYAENHGASVNDMLLAATLRTLHSMTGRDVVTVPCPVDLRRFAAPGQRFELCNLTGNYWCGLDLRVPEPFADTLRRVTAQMRAQKNSVACLKEPMLFHALYAVLPFALLRRLFPRLGGVPVTSFSNLGVLSEERLRFAGCEIEDAFLATAVKHPPYYQLSLSTWRGACTLSSCVDASAEDVQVARQVLNKVIEEIQRL